MATTTPPVTEPQPAPRQRRRVPSALVLVVVALVLVAAVISGLAAIVHNGGLTSSQGSGVIATETRTVPRFTAVELAGANNVSIRVGPVQRVVVKGDGNLIDLVVTTVRSGTLVITARHGFTTRSPLSVEVTVPSLAAVTLSGSGAMRALGVNATSFSAALTGTGTISATGSAERVNALLSGVGDLRLDSLAARDVTAALNGAGRIAVQATDSLDATLSGTGAIVYGGDPATVTKNVPGAGSITPAPQRG